MDYNPNLSVSSMTIENFVWSIIGILLGLSINQFCTFIFEKYKITNKIYKIIIQIFLCSIILSYIHVKMNNYFGWTWQNITPGLFFVSFFFSVQYNIFNDINLLITAN
jgi:hypothetical protein